MTNRICPLLSFMFNVLVTKTASKKKTGGINLINTRLVLKLNFSNLLKYFKALLHEKTNTSQRLNIAHRILFKYALTN